MCPSMIRMHRSACRGSSAYTSRSVSNAILIAAIGVRSSWLALATKSVFICTVSDSVLTSRSTSSTPPPAVRSAWAWNVSRWPSRMRRTSRVGGCGPTHRRRGPACRAGRCVAGRCRSISSSTASSPTTLTSFCPTRPLGLHVEQRGGRGVDQRDAVVGVADEDGSGSVSTSAAGRARWWRRSATAAAPCDARALSCAEKRPHVLRAARRGPAVPVARGHLLGGVAQAFAAGRSTGRSSSHSTSPAQRRHRRRPGDRQQRRAIIGGGAAPLADADDRPSGCAGSSSRAT